MTELQPGRVLVFNIRMLPCRIHRLLMHQAIKQTIRAQTQTYGMLGTNMDCLLLSTQMELEAKRAGARARTAAARQLAKERVEAERKAQ